MKAVKRLPKIRIKRRKEEVKMKLYFMFTTQIMANN